MFNLKFPTLLLICIVLLLASPVAAFGAGNIASIAKIEGTNWRHGDIEDTLLSLLIARVAGGKKFDKVNVSRVYFGNWLRDYSQAIDVGTVKYVSAEAIRILLWVLGFLTFGYGTKEFEVTAERLGCYRPEDHIDNPKDYADNVDATQFDARFRGPVNEQVELAIDPRSGMKNYIANESVGIMTSALHVRRLFGECIRLGRSYAQSKNKDELYEALRLLGTGLHCLEDFAAHSNYIELALIELGEHDVFPHVGRQTKVQIQGARGPVFPITTGTFGGVDFLHSVLGEFNDKATQSEIQELEGAIKQDSKGDFSLLKDLLGKIPKGVFEGKDQASRADELKSNSTNAQMDNLRVSPRQPEHFTRQMQDMTRQIYPILEWHDDTMKSITKAIEKIPILPEIMSKLEEQINIFVFSLIAPFLLPLINQVKNELNTGSSEIIKSSKDKQFIVFDDDYSSDPTHSMLSKDHFSNVLNEPAGKIAAEVLKWVVPQLMQCWDDSRIDVDRTLNRILQGSLNHPALRNQGEDGAADGRQIMFRVVENWWNSLNNQEKYKMRQNLSRDGVKNGKNHQGTPDCGHGCGHPIKMNKTMGDIKPGSGAASVAMTGLSSVLSGKNSSSGASSVGKIASKAAGGGVLGGLVGAIAEGIGGSLLSGGKRPNTQNSGMSDYTEQENYKLNSNESYAPGNQDTQTGYYKPQDQNYSNTDQYQANNQSNSQFGGRTDEYQSYNKPCSQYSGRTDEYQGYNQPTSQYSSRTDEYQGNNQSNSQFGGRTDEYQGYNKPGSQYSGRTDEYQGNNQSNSQFGGRTDEYQGNNQSNSQFGGRTDEYQGYNKPGPQYSGRTDEYQGYNQPTSQYSSRTDEYQGNNQSNSQFGGRTDEYQGYNQPTSQYSSRTDEYQGNNQSNSQFGGRTDEYQVYNQSGSQYEGNSYGQQYENITNFAGGYDQSNFEGKGHRKHHSKHKNKVSEYGIGDEYCRDEDAGNSQNQQSYYSGRQDSYSRNDYGGNTNSRY
ncbi:putative nima-interacting protein [Erysiphe necator]|uniref:Putative nima-interacting protein n=1 Tax=Uncinula necator TaxID=52586 RepID=A0A0B1PBS4_UNCNE|nr:putative nima-interacting protein [Erysiphe necator]